MKHDLTRIQRAIARTGLSVKSTIGNRIRVDIASHLGVDVWAIVTAPATGGHKVSVKNTQHKAGECPVAYAIALKLAYSTADLRLRWLMDELRRM